MIGVSIAISLAAVLFAAWAVKIALRTERHTLEANDVAWRGRQTEDGWGFWFTGSASVQDVKIVLTIQGEVHEALCAALEPGVVVTVEHPRELALRDEAVTDAAEAAAANAERARPITTELFGREVELFPGRAPREPFMDVRPYLAVDVEALIFWRSPSGFPRSQPWSSRSTYEAGQRYGQ